jgi:hypothetical protein
MRVGGQHHAPAACPWERLGTNCIGGWVGPRAVMRQKVLLTVSACVFVFALVNRHANRIFSTQHYIAICVLSWLYHVFFFHVIS